MRFVYLDEAGTSAREPVSVVVGLVVEADAQRPAAQNAVSEVLGRVPAPLKDGFVFHATDLWNEKILRDAWDFEDRRTLMMQMMSLPRRLKIPIALGKVRRDAEGVEPGNVPLRLEQFHHVVAFGACIEQADDYVRRFGAPKECMTLVAENVPEIQPWLRKLVTAAQKQGGWLAQPHHQQPTIAQAAAGVTPAAKLIAITTVADVVHFVEKEDAPLLQLADACAFGFRRYFAEQSFGTDFVKAILGQELVIEDWRGGISQFTFHSEPFAPL